MCVRQKTKRIGNRDSDSEAKQSKEIAAFIKMASQDFAKSLLKQEHLYIQLVAILKQSAEIALKKKSVQNAANNINVLPIGIPDLTRRVAPLTLKAVPDKEFIPIVHFDPRSITVVGGAAVQAYHIYNPMEQYYVQTSDIDAVWWPKIILPSNFKKQLESATLLNTPLEQRRNDPESNEVNESKKMSFYPSLKFGSRNADPIEISNDAKDPLLNAEKYAVVSSSQAIQTLASEYTTQLKIQLNAFVRIYASELIQLATELYGPGEYVFQGASKFNNLFIAGSCNIWGYIVVTRAGEKLASSKLIELTLHDGASSQFSNTIEEAETDFIFSRHLTKDHEWTPATVKINDVEVHVPRLDRLLQQQLESLKKRAVSQKTNTTILRCKFLHHMIRDKMGDAVATTFTDIFASLCSERTELASLCIPMPAEPLATPILPTPAPPLLATPIHPMHPMHHVGSIIPTNVRTQRTPRNVAPRMKAMPPIPPGAPPPHYYWIYAGVTPDGLFHMHDLYDPYRRPVDRKYQRIYFGGKHKLTRKRKTRSRKNYKKN